MARRRRCRRTCSRICVAATRRWSQFAPIRPGACCLCVQGCHREHQHQRGERRLLRAARRDAVARPDLGADQEPNAIVISAEFWRDRLAQDGQVIGSSIVLDGRPRTIVGVMPAGVRAAVLLDHGRRGSRSTWRRCSPTFAHGARSRSWRRRAPQASPQDLDAYLAVFSTQEQERFPQMHGGQAWVARPLRDELVGSARPALVATAAAAALLLLIVATNIAGLSTAHAVSARHQLAVRAALGATRRAVVRRAARRQRRACRGRLAWPASGSRTR